MASYKLYSRKISQTLKNTLVSSISNVFYNLTVVWTQLLSFAKIKSDFESQNPDFAASDISRDPVIYQDFGTRSIYRRQG